MDGIMSKKGLEELWSKGQSNELAKQMAEAQMADMAYDSNSAYFLDSCKGVQILQTSSGWRSEMWVRQQWKRGLLGGTKEHWNSIVPGLID
jgi:hypothetical protein